ncbi:MAG: hypothetical protein XD75_0462 [Parcubacteria bacterium 33_209]|nr:MAG: hypothetical protein XD75_0462 [Parcubacteria bacterium 33_209]
MKMKKNKIKISFMLLSPLFFFAGIVSAESSLYVSPETLTVNTNSNITSYVSVIPNGEKVCVVKGSLSFNNLDCKSIVMAEGLMAQKVPTCSDPNFTLGIPTCTLVNKNLFTVQSNTKNSGTANISLINLNIIGEGVSVGSKSNNVNYTVNAPQKPEVVTQDPKVIIEEVEDSEIEVIEEVPEEVTEEFEETDLQKASLSDLSEDNTLKTFAVENRIIIYSIIVILLIILVAMYVRNSRKD